MVQIWRNEFTKDFTEWMIHEYLTKYSNGYPRNCQVRLYVDNNQEIKCEVLPYYTNEESTTITT